MPEKPSPLSDLSFFKFPPLTPEVVTSIGALFVLLGVTVIVTVIVHNWVQERSQRKQHRTSFEHITREERQPKYVLEMLQRLLKLSPLKDAFHLVHDALAFETAVAALYESSSEEELQEQMDVVTRLRRIYHINVMNPMLQLECTRQLLPDLPVRIVSKVGDEMLDLYCSLLNVNEGYMLVNLPRDAEIEGILRAHPQIQLIFWREQEGETVFQTALEFVPSDDMTLVRAKHVFRSQEVSQRADFRLTVNFPMTWRYVARDQLGAIKTGEGAKLETRRGEGQMLDISYGGAAFVVNEALAPGGLAQLQFQIHQNPVHMMLEVISQSPTLEGAFVHRGRFRGMSQEIRNRIFNYLSREQVVRLRDREVIRRRSGGGGGGTADAGAGEPEETT